MSLQCDLYDRTARTDEREFDRDCIHDTELRNFTRLKIELYLMNQKRTNLFRIHCQVNKKRKYIVFSFYTNRFNHCRLSLS